MLAELEIRDFALIEHVIVPFKPGLNILTGETGAGKSIIIDALHAVLGGKAGPASLRAGAEKAVIEATFRLTPDIAAWLRLKELADGDDESLTVSREISKSGSKMRVNGTLVNSAQVQEIGQRLISFHAQHEARTLLSRESQLSIVDSFLPAGARGEKELIATLFARFKSLEARLAEISISEAERMRRLDFQRFQLDELQEARLQSPDEDSAIAREIRVLDNVAQLEEASGAAQVKLAGADLSEGTAAIELVQGALFLIERAAGTDPELSPVSDCLRSALDHAEEAARALRRYREGLDTDPERLAALETRAAELAAIKRKYGPTLAAAIETREKLAAEIDKLERSAQTALDLDAQVKAAGSELLAACQELSACRKEAAARLSERIVSGLAELGMDRCSFQAVFETCEPGVLGADRVEFLLGPNPGQPAAPLAKIASGGELSRVMLLIKSIAAGADGVSTVVFDEIDSGLSGAVLKAVRDKLSALAASHQILCITHQPIIASVADNHIEVSKEHGRDRTDVSVRLIDGEERVASLAGMAFGHGRKEEAVDFARALIAEGARLRAV